MTALTIKMRATNIATRKVEMVDASPTGKHRDVRGNALHGPTVFPEPVFAPVVNDDVLAVHHIYNRWFVRKKP